MKSIQHSKILKLAKSYIDSPEKLAKEAITSEDILGNVVPYYDPRAVKHCVGNAIYLACSKLNNPEQNTTHLYFFKFAFGIETEEVGRGFKAERTIDDGLNQHPQIMKAFDLAISAAEEDEKTHD